MLTRCITIAITFLFISCESWYSYCFDINNNTNDSIKIITTPMISNYNIQIHNVYFQDHYCPRKSINNSLKRPSALRF